MKALTSTTLNTLVERVIRRLSEDRTSYKPAKTGQFRYNAAGEALPDAPTQVSSTGDTQMPPTQHPPTMPAVKSQVQQQADTELHGSSISRNPDPMRNMPSQKASKINAVKKALDAKGYTADAEKAKRVTNDLNTWYSQLDPSDALVATADELAARFSSEG